MVSKRQQALVIVLVVVLVSASLAFLYSQSVTKAPPDKILLSLDEMPGDWDMTHDVAQYYDQTGSLHESNSYWIADRVFRNYSAHYIVEIYVICMNSTSAARSGFESVKSSIQGYWSGWQNTTYGNEGAVAHDPGYGFLNGYYHVFRTANILVLIWIDDENGAVIDNMPWMDELLRKQSDKIDRGILFDF
jgi:hypothetical protein